MEINRSNAAEAAVAPGEAFDSRTQQVLDLLAGGVEATRAEPGMRAYLNMLANLHEYSPWNCLLIAAQHPAATIVNSFERWKRLGRYVRRGQRGLKIFYPIKRTITQTDSATGEESRTEILAGFGIGNVWDVSQTEGRALPPRPRLAQEVGSSEAAARVNRRVSAWLVDDGVTCESKDFPGNALGFYNPSRRQIVVRRAPFVEEGGTVVDDPLSIGKTRVLMHEAAHYLADHRGETTPSDAEYIAEGATYVTLQHLGIDTAELSLPYLALWGADEQRLRANVVEIGHVSRLLTEISTGYHLTPQAADDTTGPRRTGDAESSV